MPRHGKGQYRYTTRSSQGKARPIARSRLTSNNEENIVVARILQDLILLILRMVGIPAWDGKADGVFGGRPSCSSLCPMGCCMVKRGDLGKPVEWLQRRILNDKIASVFCEPSNVYSEYPCRDPDSGEAYGFLPQDFPKDLKDKIKNRLNNN